MAESPDIHTARLLITPFSERHLSEHYVGWLNDMRLMRYSEQRHRVHTLEECRAYLQSFAGTPNFFWAIEETSEGLGHIGNVNAYVDPRNGVADIGLLIGEERVHGKGFGAEAFRAVCTFLFEESNMRKVTAGTLASNRAMLGLMDRCGMVDDGTRSQHLVCDGRATDVVHKALFRDQWQA